MYFTAATYERPIKNQVTTQLKKRWIHLPTTPVLLQTWNKDLDRTTNLVMIGPQNTGPGKLVYTKEFTTKTEAMPWLIVKQDRQGQLPII